MKNFIGNPFEQEYENEDELDELELGDGEFFVATDLDPLNIGPPHVEDEEDEDILTIDSDDPDYELWQDSLVEDSEDEAYHNVDNIEEDDFDYVNFPVAVDDSFETSSKSSSQSSTLDPDPEYQVAADDSLETSLSQTSTSDDPDSEYRGEET